MIEIEIQTWIDSFLIVFLYSFDQREIDGVETLAVEDSPLLTAWQLDGLARARVSAYLSNIRITLQVTINIMNK